jgi:hypothetical protein
MSYQLCEDWHTMITKIVLLLGEFISAIRSHSPAGTELYRQTDLPFPKDRSRGNADAPMIEVS